jgi:flagellar biosynthesis protein FlhB
VSLLLPAATSRRMNTSRPSTNTIKPDRTIISPVKIYKKIFSISTYAFRTQQGST